MKKRKESRIPKFNTIQEEAEFWDTHSIVDFEDETEDVDIVFELQKPAKETLILRIQKSLKKQLEVVAKKKRISVSSLSRIWLTEKLRSMSS